jgi:hypothetical protein
MESTSRRNRVFSNFMALGILQGANFLLPVLVIPFVIKKIGADGYGVVAVAQVVMLTFCTVTEYGFNLTLHALLPCKEIMYPKMQGCFLLYWPPKWLSVSPYLAC